MTEFVIKRVLGLAFMPLSMVFILLFLAVFLAFILRWKRLGRLCLLLSVATIVVSSLPFATRHAAHMLERSYRPFQAMDASGGPYAIVVLGNGVLHPSDPNMPALTRLNDTARARLVEGVRLARLYPGARLVTTGYGQGLENCADAMAGAAGELGVELARVDRLPDGRDTGSEAALVKNLVGNRKILLVTSAMHMERSLALFRDKGVDAMPAPCDYIAPVSDQVLSTVNRRRWLPRGDSITGAEEIVHEALGLAYMRWLQRSGE